MWGNAVSVCPWIVGAVDRCLEGVACWEDSLFGVLEGLCFVLSAKEWLLLIWSEINDIGHWWSKIVPSWWTNTFKNHDLHDKTAEGKAHSCSWSICCFPHGLKYVSTNVNIMSLHIIKLLQIRSFVSPNLHICSEYENGNKKYAHSEYIAPYIPFLPLFHLCDTSFSCTIFFSQPFYCLLHVSNNVIFISFTSSKCWFSYDTFRIFLINPFIWLTARHFTKMLSITLFIYTIDGL